MISTEIAQQFLAYRELEDGQLLALVPLLFGHVSMTLGPGGEDYEGGFDEAWYYEDLVSVFLVFLTFEPGTPPVGWIRHLPNKRPSKRRHGEPPAEEDRAHAE